MIWTTDRGFTFTPLIGLTETESYKHTSWDYNISEIGQSMPLAEIGTCSKHLAVQNRLATVRPETSNCGQEKKLPEMLVFLLENLKN